MNNEYLKQKTKELAAIRNLNRKGTGKKRYSHSSADTLHVEAVKAAVDLDVINSLADVNIFMDKRKKKYSHMNINLFRFENPNATNHTPELGREGNSRAVWVLNLLNQDFLNAKIVHIKSF